MPKARKRVREVMSPAQLRRVVRRMAHELVERNGVERLMLVGIRTRGVPLAEALRAEIKASEGVEVPMGTLDITLYRDDLSLIAPQPVVKATEIPGNLDGSLVVLCDDVLYTGRTVRAALDALVDYGRPQAVQLAVLVDRGHRELPIHADFVGKRLATQKHETVEVAFATTDDSEGVTLRELGQVQGKDGAGQES